MHVNRALQKNHHRRRSTGTQDTGTIETRDTSFCYVLTAYIFHRVFATINHASLYSCNGFVFFSNYCYYYVKLDSLILLRVNVTCLFVALLC